MLGKEVLLGSSFDGKECMCGEDGSGYGGLCEWRDGVWTESVVGHGAGSAPWD